MLSRHVWACQVLSPSWPIRSRGTRDDVINRNAERASSGRIRFLIGYLITQAGTETPSESDWSSLVTSYEVPVSTSLRSVLLISSSRGVLLTKNKSGVSIVPCMSTPSQSLLPGPALSKSAMLMRTGEMERDIGRLGADVNFLGLFGHAPEPRRAVSLPAGCKRVGRLRRQGRRHYALFARSCRAVLWESRSGFCMISPAARQRAGNTGWRGPTGRSYGDVEVVLRSGLSTTGS